MMTISNNNPAGPEPLPPSRPLSVMEVRTRRRLIARGLAPLPAGAQGEVVAGHHHRPPHLPSTPRSPLPDGCVRFRVTVLGLSLVARTLTRAESRWLLVNYDVRGVGVDAAMRAVLGIGLGAEQLGLGEGLWWPALPHAGPAREDLAEEDYFRRRFIVAADKALRGMPRREREQAWERGFFAAEIAALSGLDSV